MRRHSLSCVLALGLSSFGAARATALDNDTIASGRRHGERPSVVFTSTNEAEGNRVLAFTAAPSGELGEPTAFATGGLGTGDSLGSQGAVALSDDQRFLLVVNAGSSDITSFAVDGANLTLADRASSSGMRPISVTVRRGLVYVVNAGGTANVAGFYLDARGKLHALNGASRPLSTAAAGPAQIELTPDARALVVTEKATSKIDVFAVSAFGKLDQPNVVTSAGTTPFGFEFTERGYLIVSEAASASLSSYAESQRTGLEVISAVVPDTQKAPCWVAISADDRYAYTANAGSASISSYEIGRGGQIRLQAARAGELAEGGTPLDLTLGRAGRYLYALDRGNKNVTTFAVQADGMLVRQASAGVLPAFATGLIAY
jgi:6-phosphogluconolactonase (cycloisomerase 2 family)